MWGRRGVPLHGRSCVCGLCGEEEEEEECLCDHPISPLPLHTHTHQTNPITHPPSLPHPQKQKVLDMPFFTQGRLTFAAEGSSTIMEKKPPVLESEDGKFLYCDLDALMLVPK